MKMEAIFEYHSNVIIVTTLQSNGVPLKIMKLLNMKDLLFPVQNVTIKQDSDKPSKDI